MQYVTKCFPSSLGCGIGYGYLHRIPIKDQHEAPIQPKAAPGTDGFSDVSATLLP